MYRYFDKVEAFIEYETILRPGHIVVLMYITCIKLGKYIINTCPRSNFESGYLAKYDRIVFCQRLPDRPKIHKVIQHKDHQS